MAKREKAKQKPKSEPTTSEDPSSPPAEPVPDDLDPIVRKHLTFGWWVLAVFAFVGLVLEGAHGLKLGWYLDVTSSTRRLSLTLGHSHGTLLGLVNIAFALSLRHTRLSATAIARASFALRLATVLLPLGFLLGGFVIYAGDPGLGIVLVPPSAVILIIGLATFARGFSTRE